MSKQISQMKEETFGEFIRKAREGQNLPLRKVAALLDIDTSTLSKIEREERPIAGTSLKLLSEILRIDLKELQIKFISSKVINQFGDLQYLAEGLKAIEKKLKHSR